ncbi:uncharacterized protein LOC129571354 [Sitodiplosis mosellana]|uniref:uncharacterized protein LOC129571354 n=1 Tax=Sitodiplosis mosellana TaxID=263140 RepID=UPI0024446481|nr:uncharacterized protein LOC129571354 [Sitodiplosis mosellana]
MQSMKAKQIKFTRIRELEAECMENDVTIIVNDNECECTCTFFRTMKLPCAHIIAFFMHHDECPFKPSLCANRWKRSNVPFSSEFVYSASNSHQIVTVPNETQRRRDMTPNEKFHYAEVETKKVCEILSEKSQADYDLCLLKLKELRVCVEKNQIPNIQSPASQVHASTQTQILRPLKRAADASKSNEKEATLGEATVPHASTSNQGYELRSLNRSAQQPPTQSVAQRVKGRRTTISFFNSVDSSGRNCLSQEAIDELESIELPTKMQRRK